MILAFSPEQAQEVAQAFEIAAAVDAPWWLNSELHFPNQDKTTGPSNHEKNSSTSTADAKPQKNSTNNTKPATTGRPSYCRGNPCFRPCRRRFYQGCPRRPVNTNNNNNNNNIIEQRTPIHMHQETEAAAKMSLDVTGFDPQNISIHVEDYIVSIQGTRTNKLGDAFSLNRRFRLDKNTASVEQVRATFDEGILELIVPKKSPAGGPRKIPIVVSASVVDAEPLAVSSRDEEEKTVVAQNKSVEEHVEPKEESQESVKDTTTADSTDEETEKQDDAIAVETVDEVAIEEDKDQESYTEEGIVANQSTEEEETWEEVSN